MGEKRFPIVLGQVPLVQIIGGMFQGYTLGNLIGSQFFQAALKAHPEISTQMEEGNFLILHHWLKENIYQHGKKYTASERLERVNGKPLSIEPFISYSRQKYGEIYAL